jgi:hypothetical protein
MMNFKTDVESIIFHNYFVPNNIFEGRSFGGGDPRQFKACKKCPTVKETTVVKKDGESPGEVEIPKWKIPRMHHCSVCERCCAKYDHHCGMAINCIGINNYKLFTLFLPLTLLVRIFLNNSFRTL